MLYTLHVFADSSIWNSWIYAATSIATTLEPTDTAPSIVQSLSYSFLTVHFQNYDIA